MTQLWGTQRQGHPLHRVCAYQGSFPPQLPAYFLDKFSDAQTVLDPFCGRGTVVLEAALRGKHVIGSDVSPLARQLSAVKLVCPSRDAVMAEIGELKLSPGKVPAPPADVAPFYHTDTWPQVWQLRAAKRSDALTAVALGKLHGHSPGFFSCTTFNVISIHGKSLERLKVKHADRVDTSPRDVKQLLLKAAKKFIPEQAIAGRGRILRADARRLPLENKFVDLVITSPPFLDVIDYADVNWLRLWFLGVEDVPSTFFRGLDAYKRFLRDTLRELARVLSPAGRIVFEVGPVKRHTRLNDLVVEASKGLLHVEDIAVHSFEDAGVSKISRAMAGGEKTTTMSNHCVIMRRL